MNLRASTAGWRNFGISVKMLAISKALEMALVAYARRFPVRRGKLRVVNRLWSTAARGRGTHRIAKLKYGGLKMPCDIREMLQRQIFFFGTYFIEEEIIDCWMAFAEKATVIFDVGANAGIYSLAALVSQHKARVYAFEPTPEIAKRLRECAQLNNFGSNLLVYEVAASDRNGEARLHRCRGELGSNEGMNYIGKPDEPGGERVSIISLDQFCQTERIDHIDLLKLDVQGHEHSVLLGAKELIGAGHLRTIFMELNWGKPGQECPATESIGLLAQSGYRFSNPRDPKEWQEPGDWILGLSDVVAYREVK
jgi:FkbM family methyltransferase